MYIYTFFVFEKIKSVHSMIQQVIRMADITVVIRMEYWDCLCFLA